MYVYIGTWHNDTVYNNKILKYPNVYNMYTR